MNDMFPVDNRVIWVFRTAKDLSISYLEYQPCTYSLAFGTKTHGQLVVVQSN